MNDVTSDVTDFNSVPSHIARHISKSNMAVGNIEESLANLFELRDKERLFEIDIYDSGGTKYKGRDSSSLSVLNRLRLEGEAGFCDVILEVEGRQLTTHRCVLAANSQFFYTMFSSGMKESNQKVLSLQSICFTSMSLILDYFYTREIVINDENVLDLLNASSFLLVTPVKNACIEHLSSKLGSDNCFSVLQIAEQFGADELAEKANNYIKTNFSIVVKNEEFVSISQEELVCLISSNDILVEEEEEVYRAVLKWVKHDEANRVAVLPELLKHLRKDSLAKGFLESEMEREPLLMVARSDCDPAAKEIRKARGRKRSKKGKSLKSVQEVRPSTEIHNVMIGVQKGYPRKAFFYDLEKSETHVFHVKSELESIHQIVLVGRTLYMIGENYYSPWKMLTAVCLDDLKCAKPLAGERRPLELKTKTFFGADIFGEFVAFLNGSMYYMGGCHIITGSCHETVDCYNPEMDEWSVCAGLNRPRCLSGCVAFEQNIYVICGAAKLDSGSLLSSVEKYDSKNNCWSYVAGLKEARSYPECVCLSGKIYAIGGKGFGGVNVSSCEVYSPLTDEWHTIAQLPNPYLDFLNDVKVIIFENQITVCLSSEEESISFEALQYNMQSNKWLQVKTLGPSDKKGPFCFCTTKLPVFILQRIAREFCEAGWDCSDEESSDSDSESF